MEKIHYTKLFIIADFTLVQHRFVSIIINIESFEILSRNLLLVWKQSIAVAAALVAICSAALTETKQNKKKVSLKFSQFPQTRMSHWNCRNP